MQPEPKRLYRSRDERMIGGVCAGIAHYLNLDPTVVRLLFVLIAFVTSGIPALVGYLILLIIVPEEPLAVPASSTVVPPASDAAAAEAAGFADGAQSEPPSPEI